MTLHLVEIGTMVGSGEHAVLLLDQARGHIAGDVVAPDNVTLLPLPLKCAAINVMENVRKFIRDNWLPNRVFQDHDDIVVHCCDH